MNDLALNIASVGLGVVIGALPAVINPILQKYKVARYQTIIKKTFSLLDLVVGQVGLGLNQKALYDLVRQIVLDVADGQLSSSAVSAVVNYVLKRFDIQLAAKTAARTLPPERIQANIEDARDAYLSARELLGVKPAQFPSI